MYLPYRKLYWKSKRISRFDKLLAARAGLAALEADHAGDGEYEENTIVGLVQIAHDRPGDFDELIDFFLAFDHGEDGAMSMFLPAHQVGQAGHEREVVTQAGLADVTKPGTFQDGDAGHLDCVPGVEDPWTLFKVVYD